MLFDLITAEIVDVHSKTQKSTSKVNMRCSHFKILLFFLTTGSSKAQTCGQFTAIKIRTDIVSVNDIKTIQTVLRATKSLDMFETRAVFLFELLHIIAEHLRKRRERRERGEKDQTHGGLQLQLGVTTGGTESFMCTH